MADRFSLEADVALASTSSITCGVSLYLVKDGTTIRSLPFTRTRLGPPLTVNND